jgi:aspartyl protease family protein
VYSPELKDWIKDGFWYKLDNTGSVTESKKMESISIKKISEIEQADINPDSPSISIKLIKTESGLLEVPVELNGVLKINFIFDSGASEVSLSPDVALTLIRTGTVSNTDFLPDQTYKFADGSIAKSKRFLIKELSIGAKKLYNIEASIANSIEAPMLIGQNVMNKLGSITIDYDSQLLIIKSK